MESWWDLAESRGYQGNELALLRIICPFCSEKGNFAVHSHTERTNANGKTLNYDLLRCENCGNLAAVFWARATSGGLHDWRMVPWPLRYETHPDSWPKDVGRFWLQAKRAQQGKNWDSAAVMARSALQLALRHAGANGKDLYHEIDDLAAKGVLPPLMKEWAHEVRLLARDPAHPRPGDEETSQQDVRDAIEFLAYLLQYPFTLPNDIAAYRERRKAG